MMGGLHKYKPEAAMFGLQFTYACLVLIGKAALLQGMSPRVFVVYRHAIATLVVAPIAFFSRRKSNVARMGLRSFSLIFLVSLIGVTINQNFYFEGLYFASSSMASAMSNLIPAITFLLAFTMGLEKIDFKSVRSVAKVAGTAICVTGAISMALLRGPKLLNTSIFGTDSENWLLGCLFLFGSASCWSLWLILQVPVTACYPDHLSLTPWMCFLATLQSGTFAFFMEKDADAWIFHSNLEIVCCIFAGMIGSGLSFFVQAWCVAQRGPLFSAMFNPLCTVIVAILAAIFLHEQIYTGSMIGAVGVIFGLYVVLWGKAGDCVNDEGANPKTQIDKTQTMKIMIDEFQGERCEVILEEPLLSTKSNNIDETEYISKRI